MTATVPTCVPDDLIAGDSWAFDLSFADYLAGAGWDATIYLRGVGTIDIDATADGDTFQFRAAPDDTAAVAAGVYRYFVKVTDGTDVFTVAEGEVEVEPNAETAAAGALQTHAERALALVEALLEGRFVDGTEAAQILGRSWQNIPAEKLMRIRAQYRAELVSHQFGGKLPSTEVVFGRA